MCFVIVLFLLFFFFYSGGLSNYLYHVSLPEDDAAILSQDNNNAGLISTTTIGDGNSKRMRTVSETSSVGGTEHKQVGFVKSIHLVRFFYLINF